MKPAAVPVSAAAPVVARRGSRSAASASARKSAPKIPPRRTLAELPKFLRRLNQPGFMRYGRPDDYGELREQQ